VSPLPGPVRSEKQLAGIIAETLGSCYTYAAVHANVAPGASKFRDYYLKWFGQEPPLLQPDIDMLVVYGRDLVGIELKYFKLQSGRLKRSYYEGIDQALGLLRYGFDYAHLWHCFDQEVDATQVSRFVENTRDLVSKLTLPIAYGSLRVVRQGEHVLTKEIQAFAGQIYEYDKPPEVRRIQGDSKNPLREQPEAKKVREFIQHVLRIPQL
jgi:hypothetical protein